MKLKQIKHFKYRVSKKDAWFSKLKNTLFLLSADKEGKIIENIGYEYILAIGGGVIYGKPRGGNL